MKALDEIAAERRRQIEAEGWTIEHDDKHHTGDLAEAAACYASRYNIFLRGVLGTHPFGYFPVWPWSEEWFKRKTRREDLIRAGALIVAEIERIDRQRRREQWQADCLKWRGRVLVGVKSHWCQDWDGLPIDETTPEWPCGCAWAATHPRQDFTE